MNKANKKTRIGSLLLSLSLLLPLLSACQPARQGEPDTPPPFTALELASAVSSAAGEALENSPEQLDGSDLERLNTYVEAAYGLSAGAWEDCAIFRGLGAQAYEITVLRFANEEQAEHGAECLASYLAAREGDFTGYAPEQAALVSNAVVCREGLYVGLFICQGPAAAEALFLSILETGVLPGPVPSPEPEPEPKPEPEVDMISLEIRLRSFCEEELNALGGAEPLSNNTTETASQEVRDFFLEIMSEYYHIDASQVRSGFGYNVREHEETRLNYAFQLLVLRMADKEAAAGGIDGLQTFLMEREDAFRQKGLPKEAEQTANGLVVQNGRYLALFVCRDPEAVRGVFEAALLDPKSIEPAISYEVLQPVDMPQLADRLMAFCQEEIDKTPKVDRTYSPILTYYGIDEDQIKQSLQIKSFYNNSRGKEYSFELLALYMTDAEAAARAAQMLQKKIWNKVFWGYLCDFPEQAELAKSGVAMQLGPYAAMFVCQDPEGVRAEFESAVHELQPADVSQPPDPSQPPEEPDGPVFEEVNFAQPQGETDPDHPGRIKFVQPNKVDMSLYDTAGILNAWKTGDASGLSEEDRMIYQKAKEVLESVLQDGMSDHEKEAAVYDWMLRNLSYDWSHADVLAQTDRASYTPLGGLVQKSASCLGISTTFQLLMDMAEVECVTVTGAAHSSAEDHAWNMVRLDGAWYCVDATWDVIHWETGGRTWRYFNVTSGYMARTNHQWDYDAVPEAVTDGHGVDADGAHHDVG